MKAWITLLSCASLLTLAGCATTSQVVPTPENPTIGRDAARIEIRRPSAYGSALAIQVYDNGQFVGNLGPSGTLRWDRYPAPTRITGFESFNRASFGPLDLTLEPGKQYNMTVNYGYRGGPFVLRSVEDLVVVDSTQTESTTTSGPLSSAIVGRPKQVTVYAVSEPPGARIEGDGQLLGITPCPIPYNILPQHMSLTTTLRATPADMDYPRLGFAFDFSKYDGTIKETLTVKDVAPLSPAMNMGLRPGDRIVAVGGQGVTNVQQCVERIRDAGFGGEVELTVERDGSKTELKGKTYDQAKGTFYVQEKQFPIRQIAGMDKSIIHFDLRVTGPQSVTLGGASSPASPPRGKATGTGFLIATNGYVMTCYHVVQGRETITVRLHDGKAVKAKIVLHDEQDDWCVLKVPVSATAPLSIAPRESLRNGAIVFCLGYPMEGVLESKEPVAGAGNIAALQGMKGDLSHIQITIPINPGNSGSPIVDENGRWLALASHKLSDLYSIAESGSIPQGFNFATKATVIEPLLAEVSDLTLPRQGLQEKSKLEAIVSHCADAIVLVVAE